MLVFKQVFVSMSDLQLFRSSIIFCKCYKLKFHYIFFPLKSQKTQNLSMTVTMHDIEYSQSFLAWNAIIIIINIIAMQQWRRLVDNMKWEAFSIHGCFASKAMKRTRWTIQDTLNNTIKQTHRHQNAWTRFDPQSAQVLGIVQKKLPNLSEWKRFKQWILSFNSSNALKKEEATNQTVY